MDISRKKTLIFLWIAALWIACVILGSSGHFVLGMVLSVPLIGLHLMLGVAKRGVVSKKFLLYPLGIWAAIFIAGFVLCNYFANIFKGMMPSFTVFGLHPSFAPVIFMYWIGGLLTLSLGYWLYQDEVLTKEEWNAFCKEAKRIKEGK